MNLTNTACELCAWNKDTFYSSMQGKWLCDNMSACKGRQQRKQPKVAKGAPRRYIVSFAPAEGVKMTGPDGECFDYISSVFSFDNMPKKVAVEAASLPELLSNIERIANEMGGGQHAWVHLADGGRKPPGFDKATHNLFYNVQFKEREKPQAVPA